MPRDFFDPTPEQQKVILIDTAILRKAERLIESCAGLQSRIDSSSRWREELFERDSIS